MKEAIRMPCRESYQEIATKIIELIDSGTFPLGSRLPSDRVLAERFDVSRLSIRYARIALQAQGYIENKINAGAYVLDGKTIPAQVLPKVNALELTEARASFEAESAAIAASIISDEAIAELEHFVAVMSGKKRCKLTPDEADAAFHKTIARATNNQMIIFVIESMWTMRTELVELEKVYQQVCFNDSSHREEEHRLILQALKNRDPSAARHAMKVHFTRIIEALIEYSEKNAYEAAKRKASQRRDRFLLTKSI